MRAKTISSVFCLLIGLVFGLGASPGLAAPLVLKTLIPVPASADNSVAGKFATYDIAFFDRNTQLMYLADRSNASVDIFSAATNTFVTRIGGTGHLFAGQQASNDTSGPDGVVVANFSGQKQLWVGDGNSTIKAFDLNTAGFPALAGTPIATGPPTANRVDEMAFDPRDHILAVANNAGDPPFVTLVDTATKLITKKITFDGSNADGHGAPNATAGIEQAVWDPSHGGRFFISIPELSSGGPGGVAVFDPLTGNVTKVFDLATLSGGVTACSPAGLALGTGGKLLVGCGVASQSIILDPNANAGDGAIEAKFSQVSGEDMVWFDPTTARYYLAARNNPGGAVLGVIDALTDTFLGNILTTPNDHSVAADPVSGEVFVPFGGVAGNTVCPNGCIAVFSVVPEPSTLLLLGAGLFGFGGFAWRRRE